MCDDEHIDQPKFIEYFEKKLRVGRLTLIRAAGPDQWPAQAVRERVPDFKEWLKEIYSEQQESGQFATVQQGQFIISHVNDNISGLSTTGAAPCLVVSMKSALAQVYGLAHIDSSADPAGTVTSMLNVAFSRARMGGYRGSAEAFLQSISVTFGGAQPTGIDTPFDGPDLLAKTKAAFEASGVANVADEAVEGNDFGQSRNLDRGLRPITAGRVIYQDPLARLANFEEPESLTYNLLSNIMYSAIFSFDTKTRDDEEPVAKRDLIALAVRIAETTIHQEATAEDDHGDQMDRIPKAEKIDILLDSMEEMVNSTFVYPEELSHILLGWR